ncbi:MAG: aquaporin family protein [Verrucomicrobia bacterium]|nr:aquaporin family protein [Verrucomicrobiota bacterium]
MTIFLGELIGTMLLVLLGNGSVANVLLMKSKGHGGGWIVITAGWGFAVAISVYVVGWMSGGHLNPAVTLGFCLAKKTAWDLFFVYIGAQMLGAIIGAVLVWLAYFPHWQKTLDSHAKLLCFSTSPAIKRPLWNLLCEVIGTAVLLLGVLGVLDTHNQMMPSVTPYVVGILIFSIGLSLGGPTGYAINPARDLGPRIAYTLLPVKGKGKTEWGYAWIPVVGPLLGALLGTAVYLCYIQASSVL